MFSSKFLAREAIYHYCISPTSLTPRTSWLSCDHTFKSVCNIGTVRQADSKWIKQYAGLFCVLNADGQILSWKMTKSLAFENIRDNLLRLQEDCKSVVSKLKNFLLIHAVHFGRNFRTIFGSQLKVYLDIYVYISCSVKNFQENAKAAPLPSRLLEITSVSFSRSLWSRTWEDKTHTSSSHTPQAVNQFSNHVGTNFLIIMVKLLSHPQPKWDTVLIGSHR